MLVHGQTEKRLTQLAPRVHLNARSLKNSSQGGKPAPRQVGIHWNNQHGQCWRGYPVRDAGASLRAFFTSSSPPLLPEKQDGGTSLRGVPMALSVTTRIYLRGNVPAQNTTTLQHLADTLCNDLCHHDDQHGEANPMSDAEFAAFEAEVEAQGYCSECLAYAEAILGQVRLEVA